VTREEALAIFLLAKIEVKETYKIENGYWPDAPDYAEVRRASPWWLVLTEYGLIKIGWRKRVINIDWSATGLGAAPVTRDDVTQWRQGVHAYSYGKAVDYLSALREFARRSKQEKADERTSET
jgi:hypothetical protein